jgi:hypothetical protein
MKHRLLLTVLLLISINGFAQVEVRGKVIDTQGNPVARALVRAVPQGDKGSFAGTFKLDWIIADDLGRFSMKLPSGQFRFLAKNERSGFPDPLFSVNHDTRSSFPDVVVGRKRIDRVKLVLSKGGIFDATVIAAHVGTAINQAKVTIRDSSDPKSILEVFSDPNGHVEVALPSKPLVLNVSAAGFKSVELTKSNPYSIGIGERRAILVEMEQEARAN